MRLLYLCSDFGIAPSGTKGASVHLRAITRRLADLGHEVLLLSPREGPGDGHPAIRVLQAGCPPAEKTARRLRRWLTDHAFSNAAGGELRSLIYNAWVREPAIEALADDPPDAIIERLSLFGYTGVELGEAFGVPLVLEVNAPLAEEAARYRSLQLKDLAHEMERRVLNRADAVTVVSRSLADALERRGVDGERIRVIPNGVDVALFESAPPREVCRKELGLDDEFVVGFVGSLKEWHGVDVLLAAFSVLRREAPSARLLIVGTGPGEDRLRRQAAEGRFGDAVTFTGSVPHERIPRLLRAMDVAVAPFKETPDFYFSPVKLFEYMASGTCVVASAVGQIAEVIKDGVNGLLANAGDEHDLYRQLDRVRRSPQWCRGLSACALKTVKDRYTWSHSAEALSGVVEAVLDQRRTRCSTRVLARLQRS